MGYLILVRHGQSRWNLENKFTGWTDVPLSNNGILEAEACAKKLEKTSIDVAFTSKLERARVTLSLILAKQKKTGIFLHETSQRKKWSNHPKLLANNEIPVYSSDKINERYYGKLQGLNKDAARKKWGEKQVFIWRRSYNVAPPAGESLKDVCKRAMPYFKKTIMPHIKKGENVIIAAHGNSLRAIIKMIEQISDEKIPLLELPTGKPIIYKFVNGKLIKQK